MIPTEIFIHILRFVEDPATLVRCARSCKYLAELALPILWHGCATHHAGPKARFVTPTISELFRVNMSAARLGEYYLPFARIVHLSPGLPLSGNSKAMQHYLESLMARPGFFCLPRLAWLNIEPTSIINEEMITNMLGPQLVCFEWHQGDFSNNLLTHLRERCPKLESIFFDNLEGTMTFEGLYNFLETTPSLRSVSLRSFKTKYTSHLIAYIFRMPIIEMIRLGDLEDWITDDPSLIIDDAHVRPLPSLRAMCLYQVADESMSRLIRAVPNLERIRNIHQTLIGFAGIVEALTFCKRLTFVHFQTETLVEGDRPEQDHLKHLITLATACPLLRYVCISAASVPGQTSRDQHYAPPGWGSFFQRIPHIHTLHLELTLHLRFEDVAVLARSCPELTHLTLATEMDLWAMERELRAVVFPKLHSLCTALHLGDYFDLPVYPSDPDAVDHSVLDSTQATHLLACEAPFAVWRRLVNRSFPMLGNVDLHFDRNLRSMLQGLLRWVEERDVPRPVWWPVDGFGEPLEREMRRRHRL